MRQSRLYIRIHNIFEGAAEGWAVGGLCVVALAFIGMMVWHP
ncbi:hypothetical protein X767_13160 [Mesorhizobium sp. LSJC264A00]|nr:hypothetical protein X767_13160 [Mesorhizobium sp. LSJC264A00]